MFSWNGRANRAKYFWYGFVISVIAYILEYLFRSVSIAVNIVSLAALIVDSMFIVKRFHDIEKPGWWLTCCYRTGFTRNYNA